MNSTAIDSTGLSTTRSTGLSSIRGGTLPAVARLTPTGRHASGTSGAGHASYPRGADWQPHQAKPLNAPVRRSQ